MGVDGEVDLGATIDKLTRLCYFLLFDKTI
jgi:hypothetical protein